MSNWKYDLLDDIVYSKKANAKQLASRKALSRVNNHIYTKKIHTKSTTLRRGYISEIAVKSYFSKNANLGYILE